MKRKAMDVREIVDILMDSRLYFDLTIKERLMLVRHLMHSRSAQGQKA